MVLFTGSEINPKQKGNLALIVEQANEGKNVRIRNMNSKAFVGYLTRLLPWKILSSKVRVYVGISEDAARKAKRLAAEDDSLMALEEFLIARYSQSYLSREEYK